MFQFDGAWSSELDTVGIEGQANDPPTHGEAIKVLSPHPPPCAHLALQVCDSTHDAVSVFLRTFKPIRKVKGVKADIARVQQLEQVQPLFTSSWPLTSVCSGE